jgi:hypothetical protein
MEFRWKRAALGLGLASLPYFAGCSADPDVVNATSGKVPATAVAASEDDGTNCNLPSAKALTLAWAGSEGNQKLVHVSNLRDVAGVVSLTRTLVTLEGTESEEFGKTTLAPGQSADIPVPEVGVAERQGLTSLHVSGQAAFSDGEHASHSIAWATSPLAKSADLIRASDVLRPGDLGGPGDIIIPKGKVNTRLCFEYPGTFDSFGDYFTEGVPTYRPARGLRVNISGPSSFKLKEYLDENGCTSVQDFSIGGNDIRFYTGGEIYGNNFDVVDDAQGGVIQTFDFRGFVIGSGPTMTFKFDPTGSTAEQAFNVAQAAGWVFRRLGMGDPPDLLIVANADGVTKSNYKASKNRISLEAGDHDSKRTIAHEIGHWAMDSYTDFPDGSGCGSGHDALSFENQKCAIQEGFGNWWAAQAFNYVGQSNCRYAGVDCDQGMETGGSCSDKSILPTRVMETCHAGKDFAGAGNETDWSRVLWNMRSPSTGVTPEDITEWIRTANDETAWTSANVYQLLNSRANAIGGTLNKLFDTHKAVHGINHNP